MSIENSEVEHLHSILEFKKIENAVHYKQLVLNEKIIIDVKMDGTWLRSMPFAVKEKVLETSDEVLDLILQKHEHCYAEVQ